jgi:hypothetical protein
MLLFFHIFLRFLQLPRFPRWFYPVNMEPLNCCILYIDFRIPNIEPEPCQMQEIHKVHFLLDTAFNFSGIFIVVGWHYYLNFMFYTLWMNETLNASKKQFKNVQIYRQILTLTKYFSTYLYYFGAIYRKTFCQSQDLSIYLYIFKSLFRGIKYKVWNIKLRW